MRIRRQKGFTLIELMVTVFIVGLLTAIAIPSYQSHMRKSNRAIAQSFMLAAANKQEQYLLDNRQYATAASVSDITAALKVAAPSSKLNDHYTVSIAHINGNPRSFRITATPIAGNPQAADGELTLDHTGAKAPAGKW